MGLILTSSLDCTHQVNEVCLKANHKLSVLRSVKLLNRQTLGLLYKVTVRTGLDYALTAYYKDLKLSDLARLDNIQYKAGAYHYTNKEKLNVKLGWGYFELEFIP